jgi:thiol-disulfide isomerase/thioredoxin
MTNFFFMIAFAITAILSNTIAQVSNVPTDKLTSNNFPKDLKKAQPSDIDQSGPMMLNPMVTPIYDENLKYLNPEEAMNFIFSGDYTPEPYIDNNKDVKAFVLRKSTELEKAKMKKMVDRNNNQRHEKNELIGKEAFPFSVTDISGNNYTLEKLKGKVIVINFWFVECKPCVMEIPDLNKLVEKYKGKDVVFLGFATNDKSKIESFLKTKTFKYNIIANSKEIADLYKTTLFPTHIIIDSNSIISQAITGLDPSSVDDLDKQIELLLK